MNIGLTRLANQRISEQPFGEPAAVVAWMGAMQAQDYAGALWSIGLRTAQATTQAVEQALAECRIVRTWPMRGTLHLVAAADVRWLLALLTPRQIAQSAGRYRQLALDDAAFAQSQAIFAQELQGRQACTREELYVALEQGGVSPTGQRGYYMLVRAAQDGLICFGAMRGKQQTFVLLDEWVSPTEPLARDEALAELARRYFTSHGPATVQDLARWAGLTLTDAKRGLAGIGDGLMQETVADQAYWLPHNGSSAPTPSAPVYLLPGFDEFVLGYGDRSAVLDPAYAQRICPGGNGVFQPTVVADGAIKATWKRTLKKRQVNVEWEPFRAFTAREEEALVLAAQRYGEFLEMPVVTPRERLPK
ncbi:MAG: winged helix DNA-binding domain-containing protein [Caldilineaceae bacterium]